MSTPDHSQTTGPHDAHEFDARDVSDAHEVSDESAVAPEAAVSHRGEPLKVAMAISGLILILFVAVHALGNLTFISGDEAFTGYARGLREIGSPAVPAGTVLWIVRIVLLVSLVVHVICGLALWRRSRTGEPTTMRLVRWSGAALGLFLVFHILQFTTGTIQVGGSDESTRTYDRVLLAFQSENWWLYAIYVVVILALMFHIAHGFAAAVTSLGWSNIRRDKPLKAISGILALVIALALLVVPTAVVLGVI